MDRSLRHNGCTKNKLPWQAGACRLLFNCPLQWQLLMCVESVAADTAGPVLSCTQQQLQGLRLFLASRAEKDMLMNVHKLSVRQQHATSNDMSV
jgi:hypothetical protein